MNIDTAAKHGVVGMSGSLFEDVREKGIKVCCINPGMVCGWEQFFALLL